MLREEDIWVVGLDENGETIGEKTERHLTGAIGLVVGSEGEGIRQLIRSKCDIVLKLPMRGQIESLNAAVRVRWPCILPIWQEINNW